MSPVAELLTGGLAIAIILWLLGRPGMSPSQCAEHRKEFNRKYCEQATLIGNILPLLERIDERTQRIHSLETKVDSLTKEVADIRDRLGTIEGHLDL